MRWQTDFMRSIPWDELEQAQQNRVQEVHLNPDIGFLLVSEPAPTFTAGRFAAASDLLWRE